MGPGWNFIHTNNRLEICMSLLIPNSFYLIYRQIPQQILMQYSDRCDFSPAREKKISHLKQSDWLSSEIHHEPKLLNNLVSLCPRWIISPLPRLLCTCSSLRHQVNREIINKKTSRLSILTFYSNFFLWHGLKVVYLFFPLRSYMILIRGFQWL